MLGRGRHEKLHLNWLQVLKLQVVDMNIDLLLYVTPTHHADLLDCIVQTDLERFQSILSSSLGMSLRIDGSVDRSQKHNVYVLLHVITKDGKARTFFWASIYLLAVLLYLTRRSHRKLLVKFCRRMCSSDLPLHWLLMARKKNSGHLRGIWELLRKEKAKSSTDPFITIWCIGYHRVNLAWKATCKLQIINEPIKNVSSNASSFHQYDVLTVAS